MLPLLLPTRGACCTCIIYARLFHLVKVSIDNLKKKGHMPGWTFLTNHALVLRHIARQPRSTALDLGNRIGITERATRKIIADLLAAGYITKEREGRCNRYRINSNLPLRHPSHGETAVGALLRTLGWRKRPRAGETTVGQS